MTKVVLFHGSPEIVVHPEYGKGRLYNDYGRGFYCTESEALAREWACAEDRGGYVNRYELDLDGLLVLNLNEEPYTLLHWLAILLKNRQVIQVNPLMKRGMEWLTSHFMPPTGTADVIIGYRADDSYFSFARAFASNAISLAQLARAMHLGRLGLQVFLQTPAAFEALHFIGYDAVDAAVYYPLRQRRDSEARAAFLAELEHEAIEGLYLRDLIREEVMPDDPRLH